MRISKHTKFSKISKIITTGFLVLMALLIWYPLAMMIGGSFMGEDEIVQSIGKIYGLSNNVVTWNVIPKYPTLRAYVELLLDSPKFFVMFWNSSKQVFAGLLGQLLIATPAAWGLAKFNFKGKKIVRAIYIMLMILPFQVMMVSSYLVLDRLHLMNTHFAIILPIIFSTFPIFIMERSFRAVPESLIEAAKIDGANEVKIFIYLGLPVGAPGIISAVVLTFLETWNAIEAPLTFLKDKSLWPLSLYLPIISVEKLGLAMVAAIITMMPAVLIFLFGQRYLEEGIMVTGIKE